jgi:hypothetical protein
MIHNLAKRLGKIEQKVGGDTTVIKTFCDFVVYADKVKKGIMLGKVTIEPKLVEQLRLTIHSHGECKDNEQKH